MFPMTQVIGAPIFCLKGQRSKSPDVKSYQKMSHNYNCVCLLATRGTATRLFYSGCAYTRWRQAGLVVRHSRMCRHVLLWRQTGSAGYQLNPSRLLRLRLSARRRRRTSCRTHTHTHIRQLWRWLAGVTVSTLHLRSWAGLLVRLPVGPQSSGYYTWMGDCLLRCESSRYITNTKVNSTFYPSEVSKTSTGLYVWLERKQNAFTYIGWQVTLCGRWRFVALT